MDGLTLVGKQLSSIDIDSDLRHDVFTSFPLVYRYRFKPAFEYALSAFDTFFLIDAVLIFHRAADRLGRTSLGTEGTSDAFVRDIEADQRRTMLRRTLLVIDMILVLVPEIFERCQNRVWRGLSQSAERTFLDLVAELFQQFDISFFALALGDAL